MKVYLQLNNTESQSYRTLIISLKTVAANTEQKNHAQFIKARIKKALNSEMGRNQNWVY